VEEWDMKTAELLNEKGVKPTVHRIEILEYLQKTKTHPTADEVYEHFKKSGKLAVLSRATVYNALRALSKAGLIAVIITPDAIRYDYIRQDHHHFYCHKCKTIYDIELDVDLPNINTIAGHEVQYVQLTLVGVCSKCIKKED